MELPEGGPGLRVQALGGRLVDVPLAIDEEGRAARGEVGEETAERLRAEGRARPELDGPRPARAEAAKVLLEDGRGAARLEDGEAPDPLGSASRAGRRHVEEHPAADGDHRRVAPHDVPVTRERDDRSLQPELDQAALAGVEEIPVEEVDAGHHLARAGVEADTLARPDGRGGIGQEIERGVQHGRRLEEPGGREDVAALERGPLEALEVHGRALARDRLGHRLAVGLDPAHLGLDTSGVDLEALVHLEAARGDRPRHHRPEPLDGEHAVDGEPEGGVGPAGRHRAGKLGQGEAQRVEPLAGLGGDGNDRAVLEEGPAERRPDVLPHQLEPFGLGEVGLGEDDEPRPDLEELADGEVLPGLGHHALVGGDHEHDEVDPAHPGQHVLHEPLVAGHVDDAEGELGAEGQVGEADVDGDPALLLLLQAVGVDAGEGVDEGRLPVVDVAGGARDDVPGGGRSSIGAPGRQGLTSHPSAAMAAARRAASPSATVRQSSRRRPSATRPITGGRPARRRRSSSSAGWAGVPRARAAVGSSTRGRAPPPT